MSAAYQHLALAEVMPGMILSDELLDQQGQVLLPKGAVLTERIIALLPSHGIDMLAVLRSDGGTAPAAKPDPAVIEQRVARLFRKLHPDSPDGRTSELLQRYILDYRLEREIAP